MSQNLIKVQLHLLAKQLAYMQYTWGSHQAEANYDFVLDWY